MLDNRKCSLARFQNETPLSLVQKAKKKVMFLRRDYFHYDQIQSEPVSGKNKHIERITLTRCYRLKG